ncbi:YdhK family protein [Aerococcaceae bacterium INB8]|uniref:YdhK family protein n=1 Tax=Ruoffia halotolerans TaxID=2748684 RepID=A0A839A3R7_9LACT|nr:YdhK family protein [Ruoffia halotolerans]MBA5728602.1 YdhK family protein [Ruoffia halotolerans]
MKQNKKWIGTILLSSALLLGACGSDEINESTGTDTNQTTTEETSSESGDHGGMVHDESGEIPADLEEAENPTYPVGSEVIIQTDHMPGMMGATGEIVGAFDSIAYEITYTDTETGEEISNHKWVVREETENAQEEPYQAGDEVVLEAYHMPGMQGATATIDSAEDTTVYMVTYTDTETGDTVANHKWLTEDELAPAE